MTGHESPFLDRREVADWLVATGFPWDWDVETKPPWWLLLELAAAWHRKEADPELTVEDYVAVFKKETMAFKDFA